MSQNSGYKFGKYGKAILKNLVLKGETLQLELPGMVGCTERTVIREIKKLRNSGYVEDAGVERTKRRPRLLLRSTFFGVLEVLMMFGNDPNTTSEIVERNRDAWVVFEEWGYISSNGHLLALTLSAVKDWLARNTLPTQGVVGVSLRPEILQQCKHEIMAGLLWGGDPINRTTEGLIFNPETLWYFKENPRLKKHMDEAIERQAELYKMRLVIIEAWAKGMSMSKVLEEWRREWPPNKLR